MANPRIDVEIGAVIDGLRKGFGESVKIIETLETQARDLEKALNEATDLDTIGRLNQDLARTRSALSQLRTTGVEPLTKATSQYNSVGTDFARIIQDAPFGIIGVGNNITQLAGSFQTLKNQTGSTSQALKTAFASIFSSGNALILGISALTTVFTILQQKGFFKTEQSAKSLKERLDEYKSSLEGVAKATLEGASSAQKEIQSLTLLRKQAENTAVSQEKRLQAVDQLQKQYPEYLGNISKESILNGQADVAYKQVVNSILAKAKAQASANQIAQNSIELLTIETKLEEQRAKRLQETSAAQAQIDALIEKRKTNGFLTQGEIQLYDQLISRINKANETLSSDEELLTQKLKLLEQNVKLEGNVTALIEQGATFTNAQNTAKKESIKLEDELIARIERGNKLREESAKKLIELGNKLGQSGPQFKEVNVDTSGFTPTDTPADNRPALLQSFIGDVDSLLESNDVFSKVLENITKFSELTKTINSDVSFEEKLKAIGEQAQLIQGAFDALGQAVKDAFGQSNSFLGTLLGNLISFAGKIVAEYFAISTAAAVAGASSSAAATGPAAIFTLPTFLGLAAALVTSAFAGIKGSKRSSIGSSGVGGGAGSSFVGGGIGGFFNQDKTINGELVARGSDLVYVFNEANARISKG